MLGRRSSFKNQTCLVVKKSAAAPNPVEIAAPPPPSRPLVPLPHSQSSIVIQRTNNFGHHDYGQSVHPLPRSESTKLVNSTNYVGHQDYSHDPKPLPLTQSSKITQRASNSLGHGHEKYGHDQQQLPHFQSTKVTQKTNSFGQKDYGHDQQPPHFQSTKVTQKTDSIDSQDYGHDPHFQLTKVIQKTNTFGELDYGYDQQTLPHFQSTKVMQRTNSIGQRDYGYDRSTKVMQKTNSFGHRDYGQEQPPLPHFQSTTVAKRSNSLSHQEYGHNLGLQPGPNTQSTKVTQRTNSVGRNDYEPGLKAPVQKKPAPSVEFPVSPDLEALVVGEGITNANHPQHRMVQVNVPTAFTCMGCKEFGAGTRFTCQQCNFELHDYCALAPPVLKAHPLHSQHQLLFSSKPGKGGLLRSKCDVCAKSEKGYMFRCSACSFQVHPTCAMLSGKMNFPTHPHPMVILPANSLLSGDPGDLPCAECKRKRSGQVYRCTVCDYYLHAVCAKNMVNGLHANGIKGLDKPSRLGVAAKIASHVVVGFMGGLFEGIGEGLGEAITQNFVKGRCNSTRKSLYPGN